ncbi:MAG: GAF domain-containing protein [Anaerolineales bacterium]|nr:GAF domain-containing protein [Anaerolineales bacterium]
MNSQLSAELVQPEQTKLSRSSLRYRLILAFLAVAMLPFAGISLVLVISGAQGGRDSAITQLDTVVGYKENAIASWADGLKVELAGALVGEDTPTLVAKIIQTPPTSPDYLLIRESYNIVRNRFINNLRQSQNFDEIFLLDRGGVVILSSNNTQEGQDLSQSAFFSQGLAAPYTSTPDYNYALGKTQLYVSMPIFGQANTDGEQSGDTESGQVIGVMAARVKMAPLSEILNNSLGLGETGVTYLVGADRTLLVGPVEEDLGQKVNTQGIQFAADSAGGILNYTNQDGVPVTGVYRWITDLQVLVLAEQEQAEANRTTLATLAVNSSVALASILVAVFIALMVTYTIASPVSNLAETAQQLSRSAIERLTLGAPRKEAVPAIITQPVEAPPPEPVVEINPSGDEIGVLEQAFSSMTKQLNTLIDSLEQRVAERTRQLSERSNYLEASAQVSQVAASILDPEMLIREAVELIRERFNLYYVGLFLVDENQEWAVLHAGTGQAGQAMITRGHRLLIGRGSMIGWCISNSQARIAQFAESDLMRASTAELPETRSEAALPLRSRGQVLGAISVQSAQPNAFDEVSLAVLQSLADQLAVAISNARLYAESQQALQAERQAYSARSRYSWQDWAQETSQGQAGLTLRGDASGVHPATPVWYPEMEMAFQQGRPVPSTMLEQAASDQRPESIAVPINIRGSTIGVIHITRGANSQEGQADTAVPTNWGAEEIAFLENITEQLGVALDSARLYAETQQRAEQERLIGEVTSRMRTSMDVEAVLQTAVEEIYKVLDLEELVIQLSPEEQDHRSSTDQRDGEIQ